MSPDEVDFSKNPMPPFQEKLEREVISLVAKEFPELGSALLDQFAAATVTDRYSTRVGFYTSYTVPRNRPTITHDQHVIPTLVEAFFSRDDTCAGFLIFHTDGYFDLLEGYVSNESEVEWGLLREPFELSLPDQSRRA